VEQEVATFRRSRERSGITQVSRNTLHIEFPNYAAVPTKDTNPVTSFGEKSSHVPADEATRARD
jgi:hypothetical protein